MLHLFKQLIRPRFSIGLRTTIILNLGLLSILTIILIGILVLTAMKRVINDQMNKNVELLIDSIGRSIESIFTTSSLTQSTPPELLIQRILKNYTRNKEIQKIIVVDRDFTLINSFPPDQNGKRVSDILLSQAILLGKKVKSSSFTGETITIASPFYQGESIGGGFLVTIALNDIQEGISQVRTKIITYILISALLITLFGTFLLNHYLVKPINKLINLASSISEGEFHHPTTMNEKNEIEKLFYSLNCIAERIKEDKKKIEAYILSLEKTNQKLKQAQEEVLRSEKLASLGRLSAGIAHEIGNPLGVIKGYIEILARGYSEGFELKDYCKRIETEIERINRIILELLNYSRISPNNLSEVNLNHVIKEAISLTTLQKPAQKIYLNLKLEDTLPTIKANYHQMVQVMVNLILNAKDALPEGGEITISTLSSGENILVKISDTGIGIKEEDLPKIFDPFYTTKDPGKGTGLGLAITHRIIESFGGKINVKSQLGKGTTFTIILPASRGENNGKEKNLDH